jgi:hypothetical protein
MVMKKKEEAQMEVGAQVDAQEERDVEVERMAEV